MFKRIRAAKCGRGKLDRLVKVAAAAFLFALAGTSYVNRGHVPAAPAFSWAPPSEDIPDDTDPSGAWIRPLGEETPSCPFDGEASITVRVTTGTAGEISIDGIWGGEGNYIYKVRIPAGRHRVWIWLGGDWVGYQVCLPSNLTTHVITDGRSAGVEVSGILPLNKAYMKYLEAVKEMKVKREWAKCHPGAGVMEGVGVAYVEGRKYRYGVELTYSGCGFPAGSVLLVEAYFITNEGREIGGPGWSPSKNGVWVLLNRTDPNSEFNLSLSGPGWGHPVGVGPAVRFRVIFPERDGYVTKYNPSWMEAIWPHKLTTIYTCLGETELNPCWQVSCSGPNKCKWTAWSAYDFNQTIVVPWKYVERRGG